MVPRENKNNAYAKLGGTKKEYYGIFRKWPIDKPYSRITLYLCSSSDYFDSVLGERTLSNQKRQRESGSQTDEDSPAGGHCCYASKFPKEDVKRFQFEQVHRISTRQDMVRSFKPRPIIEKFSFYKDKDFMWSFVKNVKGSGIETANDFPKEIDEIHQKLYPVLKEAKRTGQKARFKVDKLIISGQVYRGAETENLVHYGLIMNS